MAKRLMAQVPEFLQGLSCTIEAYSGPVSLAFLLSRLTLLHCCGLSLPAAMQSYEGTESH
jgi:hypothetical protein